ncbi:MAG TPA: cobalamin-dependent protein [Ktedonobacterales bacterium]|nr:cobalamin-dependent protein [Ktedonobacterales bacterium]
MATRPPDDMPDPQQLAQGQGIPPGPPSTPLQRPQTGPAPTNWGRRTGPLSRPGQNTADMPDLSRFSNAPHYDLPTFVGLLGVRAVTVWAWEQNLGIRVNPGGGDMPTGLRYSERDLIAFIWLRDQIVAGADPASAAQRLREAIAQARGDAPSRPISPTPSVPRPASRPLGQRMPPSQPISRIGASLPILDPTPASQPILGPSLPSSPEGGQAISQTWTGMLPKRDLGSFMQPLMHAFAMLNTAAVTQILDEALMSRSVETTCATLIAPALARVNELWVRGDVILPEAQFAINIFKSRLFRLFDVLHEHRDAPLTFIACGPDDIHEIDALMLALFWRRAGLRVVYFGHDVDGPLLVETSRRHHPRVVALTLSSTARSRLLTRFVRSVDHLESPRPLVGFVGPILARHPEMQRKIGGVYLGVDSRQATHQVRQLLHLRETQG